MNLHRKTGGPFGQHIISTLTTFVLTTSQHIPCTHCTFKIADSRAILLIKTQNMLHTLRKDREFALSKIQYTDLHKKNNILIDEQTVEEQSLSI
jgi:hypothetical protein